jgi:alpha-ketoglutarate-dependent taurine dioxygenase
MATERESNEVAPGLRQYQWSRERPLAELARELGLRELTATPSVLSPHDDGGTKPRSLSANHGFGRFPWHSDGATRIRPPEVVLLRALTSTTTPTLLLDGVDAAQKGRFLERLATGTWLIEARHGFYASAYSAPDGVLRWNSDVMNPADETARAATIEWLRLLHTLSPHEHRWDLDSVLYLDNRRWLHARPAVPLSDRGRKLERIWCIGAFGVEPGRADR